MIPSFIKAQGNGSQAFLLPHAMTKQMVLARNVCPQSRVLVVTLFSFHLRDCLLLFFTLFTSLRACSAWFFSTFIVGRQLSASATRLLGGQGTEVRDTNQETRQLGHDGHMQLISSQFCGNVICHDVQIVSIGVTEQQPLSSRRGCFHPS